MPLNKRVFVESDQVVFEVVYSPSEILEMAAHVGVDPHTLAIDKFLDCLNRELLDSCDLEELLCQFLAGSSEEKTNV
jgi:hypothetical protein